MNDLIIAKVSAALKGHWANPDLVCPLTCPTAIGRYCERSIGIETATLLDLLV